MMKRSGYHIIVAVPTRGQIQWQTVTALEAIRDATPGLRPILYQEGNLSVAMTRNRIVKQFLASDATTLVMVDDDIAPPPHALEKLDPYIGEFAAVSIPHPMPTPGRNDEIVLSAYVFRPAFTDGLTVADLEEGMNEVDAVATGCVAISREALETLGPNPFRITNDPDAEIRSDDFLFCADLRFAGLKIGCWWDGWYCDHVRTVGLAPLLEKQIDTTNPLTGGRRQ